MYDKDFDRAVRQLEGLCRSLDSGETGVLSKADFRHCLSMDRCEGISKLEAKLLPNVMARDHAGNVLYGKLAAGMEQVMGFIIYLLPMHFILILIPHGMHHVHPCPKCSNESSQGDLSPLYTPPMKKIGY